MTPATRDAVTRGPGARGALRAIARVISRIMLGFIRFYQIGISPFLPPTCRFTPTCSHYAYDAIRLHGPAKGGWLAVRRVARCHPFNPGGYDPVPPPVDGRGVSGDGEAQEPG